MHVFFVALLCSAQYSSYFRFWFLSYCVLSPGCSGKTAAIALGFWQIIVISISWWFVLKGCWNFMAGFFRNKQMFWNLESEFGGSLVAVPRFVSKRPSKVNEHSLVAGMLAGPWLLMCDPSCPGQNCWETESCRSTRCTQCTGIKVWRRADVGGQQTLMKILIWWPRIWPCMARMAVNFRPRHISIIWWILNPLESGKNEMTLCRVC